MKKIKNELATIENEILRTASIKFGTQLSNLTEHGRGYQNLIYEYSINNDYYILRISQASMRTYEELMSELNLLKHLSYSGVSVSLPIKSCEGNLIEKITNKEETYFVTSFEKAKGAHISYPDYLNNYTMFYELGKITGKLHKSSKTFNKELNNRISWTDNYYLKNSKEFISTDEVDKINAFEMLIQEISKFPKDQNNFGLIHGDINVGNFFVLEDNITLFDFDECQNSWFIEDIAIQLFYTVYVFNNDSKEERNLMAIKFMQNFLEGYNTELEVDIEMLKFIPKFLVLREMIVHVGIYKKWDLSNLSGWADDYFRQSSIRIKDRTPIVEYNTEWCKFITKNNA